MPVNSNDSFALVGRIIDAGMKREQIDEIDARTLSRALVKAIETGTSLEKCLGLRPQWRSHFRTVERSIYLKTLVRAVGLTGSGRSIARLLHKRLVRYRNSADYAAHEAGKAVPLEDDAWLMFATILLFAGHVPTEGAIRRAIAG